MNARKNMKKKLPQLCTLHTPFETHFSCDWNMYPRPQMRRDAWLSLNGSWKLSVLAGGAETDLGTITVPFPPESRLSGIGRAPEKGEKYIYRRSFTLSADMVRARVLLHFGAVDQIAAVSVNGSPAGTHEGGYLPFTMDVTDAVWNGENTVTVTVTDELDHDFPWGKQRKKRGGMWYTPISGIWQTVWLESVPENCIRTLRLTPSLTGVTVETVGGNPQKTLILEGKSYTYTGDSFTLQVENPHLWTPEDPYLYNFTLTDGTDRIESYFALRTVTVQECGGVPRLCLNGKPYFFHGLLDQGYFPDGIYTPASPDGYLSDILTAKRLGFNMLRKHIKIEPDLFYYFCDVHGMVVFQDMVNSGGYSFLADTALPTVGVKRGIRHRASPKRRAIFENSLRETTELLYNHPCVCYYTVFNEGWGQYDADRLYGEMKKTDPTRIWDSTSGWFTERDSDVQSEHVYFRKIRLKIGKRPLVLSEFGGYSCRIEGHCFNLDDNYGYRLCADPAELEKALIALYTEEVLPAVRDGLSAAVLTQLSDVEDETNGLLTYDRCVVKVREENMRAVAEKLCEAGK